MRSRHEAPRPTSCYRWPGASFELIASQGLLKELERALAYPKLRPHISEPDAADLVRWLAGSASVVLDPDSDPPVRSHDPDDG